MKLNLLAISSLLALAAAQDASGTSTGASSATTSLSPQASCALKCNATDRCCIASCYEVPCPSDSQANDTIDCVAACPQGTGSASDTEKYAKCQSECYKSHFFPISGTGAASKPTGSSSDSTATGSGSDSTATGSSSDSESGTGTATGTGAAATETNAASQLQFGVSAMGVIGMAIGIWAL